MQERMQELYNVLRDPKKSKIDCIKELRVWYPLGLREAVDAVEFFQQYGFLPDFVAEMQATPPAMYQAKWKAKKFCWLCCGTGLQDLKVPQEKEREG